MRLYFQCIYLHCKHQCLFKERFLCVAGGEGTAWLSTECYLWANPFSYILNVLQTRNISSPGIDFPQTHKAQISLSFSVSIDLYRIHWCPLNIILLHSYHEQSLVTNGLDHWPIGFLLSEDCNISFMIHISILVLCVLV